MVLAIVAILATFYFWGRQPPSKDKVAADIIFGGDLLAYEVGDGAPKVVFRHDGDVNRAHLRLDWTSIEWPPKPAWQLAGGWDWIVASNNPASVGVLQATPTELFGEINSPAITTLEVQYDGAWHAFPVSAPGYLLRLDGFDGIPTGYRWLDAQGNPIHTRDRVEPIEP